MHFRRLIPFGLVLGALAVAVVLRVGADQPVPQIAGSSPIVESSPAADTAPGHAALRATLDPEGGLTVTSRPAADAVGHVSGDRLELDPVTANALSRDFSDLQREIRTDGSVHVNLKGRFQCAAVLRIAEDGTRQFVCTEHAEDAMNAPAPAGEASTWEVQ